MDESKETKKSRNITFRLTNKQYEQVENAALAAGALFLRPIKSRSETKSGFERNDLRPGRRSAKLFFIKGDIAGGIGKACRAPEVEQRAVHEV